MQHDTIGPISGQTPTSEDIFGSGPVARGKKLPICRRKDLRSSFLYKVLSSLVIRVWMPELSSSEFAVLMFIFDRTIGWGKGFEVILARHIVSGVHGRKNGRTYSRGTGLSKSTIQRALKRLEARDLLAKLYDDDKFEGNSYAIVFETLLPEEYRELLDSARKYPEPERLELRESYGIFEEPEEIIM